MRSQPPESGPVGRVALISLEPWDDVMRRNQHLASRLVADGTVSHLVFVEPVAGGLAPRARRRDVAPGITALTPPSVVPRRLEGHRATGAWLRRELRGVDVVWVNDPVLGLAAVPPGAAVLYDVTDDWRSMAQGDADRRRIVAAEDRLAGSATTVVCSGALAERWLSRYGVDAAIVQNGVDTAAIAQAAPTPLDAPGPHAVYVGTVHRSRVDSALVEKLATAWPGTVHLVGPTELGEAELTRLRKARVRFHGRQPSADVPRFLAAADVLICPHLVDKFTLSLDAIKSHEYLATDKPVIATASSGFQSLSAPGLQVVEADGFPAAAVSALAGGRWHRDVAVDWDERATSFGAQLMAARGVQA